MPSQAASPKLATVDFSSKWHILGPFQIGTREATWGADPLELLGGFRHLSYNSESTFKSPLTPNGTVHWGEVVESPAYPNPTTAKVDLTVTFPNVDWAFHQSVYGWAALQYQAWARGVISVDADDVQTIELYTDGVLEFSVNGETYYGGDVYSFRKAPAILRLHPGQHQFDVRLVRDVRAMGAVADPEVNIGLELRLPKAALTVDEHRLLTADVVDGKLASSFASFPVRNTGLRVVKILSLNAVDHEFSAKLLVDAPIQVLPGQTRSISFEVACLGSCSSLLRLSIEYQDGMSSSSSRYLMTHELRSHSLHDPHKITFLHPSGTVSYAILRPPAKRFAVADNAKHRSLPILINLHGAGVEADNEFMKHSLDAIADIAAWTLIPSGGTPWSGDDWHQWGWTDVEASIAAIPDWMQNVDWSGPEVNLTRWLVAGHSNGGQGTWHILTHRPDNIIAAAPVSGYLSIQKYVPYSFWREVDPRRTAVVMASMNSQRHEVLIANSQGIPIFQQHGGADDNVPTYHSRRMSELIAESGWRSGYLELEGEGHWFDGIMTTRALRQFYEDHLSSHDTPLEMPPSFTMVVANPADAGPKFGIYIDQLMDSGQLGYVEGSLNNMSLYLRTSNIETLRLPQAMTSRYLIVVDGQPITTTAPGVQFCLSRLSGKWMFDSEITTQATRRSGRQLGHLEAFLNTKGHLAIVNDDDSTKRIALQISRNLFQYFGADAEILESQHDHHTGGNFVRILIGPSASQDAPDTHPIHIDGSKISIRDDVGFDRHYAAGDQGLASIFLRPSKDEGLELVIWGNDISSVNAAARLVPMLTGVGQPDFVVLTQACLWKGVGDVLAMGFFDSSWNVTRSSFLS